MNLFSIRKVRLLKMQGKIILPLMFSFKLFLKKQEMKWVASGMILP
jgi:hypothetical protein